MRRLIVLWFVGFLLGFLIVLGVGEALCSPASRTIGPPPADLDAFTVRFWTDSGQPVAGWFARGRPGGGAVLLLHGVRSDRRQMIGRARFLTREGYSVLLIDLPAHGESAAEHITYGIAESEGVSAALSYLRRQRPHERIGVIGVSLGAASVVLSRPQDPLDAIVLESMYPTIKDALTDRIRLHAGAWATPLAPLLLWQLPLRLGISPEQLQPIESLRSLKAPVLIAAGSDDQHTTVQETLRIFAAANDPKELWIVRGARHVDLYAFESVAYENRVGAFLAKHLRP